MANGFFSGVIDAIVGLFSGPAANTPPTDPWTPPSVTWSDHADAVGWTRARFAAAAREVESRLGEAELEGLRIDSWSLAWSPRPLRFGYLTTEGKQGKPGKTRVIGHASARDEVLMAVWRGLAERALERTLAPHVHGFRRGRGTTSAVKALTAAPFPAGASLVRADVKSMFPSLKHGWLLRSIKEVWGTDTLAPVELRQRLTGLAERWVTHWNCQGVPTGTSISPMLSNAYFATGIDRWLADALASGGVLSGIRYADDFALVTDDPDGVLRELRAACSACGVELNEAKTQVRSAAELAREPEIVLGVPLRLVGMRLVGPPRPPKAMRPSRPSGAGGPKKSRS